MCTGGGPQPPAPLPPPKPVPKMADANVSQVGDDNKKRVLAAYGLSSTQKTGALGLSGGAGLGLSVQPLLPKV